MSKLHDQPQARTESGFSLVEVLLALAISGIVFASVFTALDQAIRSRNDMANQATPYIQGPAILDRIAKDLRNEFFYDLKNNNAFYGTDAELNGEEADALSFITTAKTYAPLEYNGKDDLRDSYLNEVAYLCRRGPAGSPFLQLWRREDFFVDDYPHAGGDYVLMYDKVKSIQFRYVARTANNGSGGAGGGVAAPSSKDEDEMIQDGWNSIKEQGVPRAVYVVIEIYAADDASTTEEKVAAGKARSYRFERFIALPQIDMSPASEQAIASWDGQLNQATAVTTGRNIRDRGANNQGGATNGASRRNNASGRNNRSRGGGRGGRGGRSNTNGINSFLQALRGAGGGGGSGGGNPFAGLGGR